MNYPGIHDSARKNNIHNLHLRADLFGVCDCPVEVAFSEAPPWIVGVVFMSITKITSKVATIKHKESIKDERNCISIS